MNTNFIQSRQTALITGASSGLGLEFVRQLAKLGVNLILVSRNEDKLNNILKEFKELPIKIWIFPCNLSVESDISRLIDYCEANKIGIDILINNVGKGIYGAFDSIESEETQKLINLNLTAPVLLSQYTISKMKAKNSGIILDVSSTMAFRPSPQWSVYAASKSFLFSFSRSLQMEYSVSNILISVLCPGKIDTNFDMNAGYKSNRLGTSAELIVAYTLRKLNKRKQIIIPGLKAKLIYFVFKYFPLFITDKIIRFLT